MRGEKAPRSLLSSGDAAARCAWPGRAQGSRTPARVSEDSDGLGWCSQEKLNLFFVLLIIYKMVPMRLTTGQNVECARGPVEHGPSTAAPFALHSPRGAPWQPRRTSQGQAIEATRQRSATAAPRPGWASRAGSRMGGLLGLARRGGWRGPRGRQGLKHGTNDLRSVLTSGHIMSVLTSGQNMGGPS